LHWSVCSSGDGGGGNPAGGLVDSAGNAITSVDSNDPVTAAFTGLAANKQYSIVVADPTGALLSPEGGFKATSDEDGEIPAATLVQDLSETDNPTAARASWTQAVEVGQYTVTVTDEDGNVIYELTFDVVKWLKVFCADDTGAARASFTPSQPVFAKIQKGRATSPMARIPAMCCLTSTLWSLTATRWSE